MFRPDSERRGIAHVLTGLPFGGNETLCIQLMRAWRPEDRQLVNIGPEPEGPMLPLFEQLEGFQTTHLPYSRHRRVRFTLELARVFRRLHPRAVITYPFGLHLLVAAAARLAGVGRVFAHAGNPPPMDAASRRLWRRILVASRMIRTPVVPCSLYVEREMVGLAGRMPDGSRTIENGIDIRLVMEKAQAALGARGTGPVVGMTARLNSIKDQATLLRAFSLLRHRHPAATLWLVGDGERRQDLEELASSLGLSDSVTFWGRRADVPELLAGMDVYVFSTTRDEGFGIALAEAMAVGLPVIASDVPACREVLGEGAHGWLVPPGNPVALADQITRFLDDEPLRRRWGEIAKARAPDFDIERCAKRWRALVDEAS